MNKERLKKEELIDNQKMIMGRITKIKTMMMMRIKMETYISQESKAVDKKNKNKETYKENRESPASQIEIKETIVTEQETKRGREKGNS